MSRGSGGCWGSRGREDSKKSEEVNTTTVTPSDPLISSSPASPASPASPTHFIGDTDSLLEAYSTVALALQLHQETIATVAQIQLLQEILNSQRKKTVKKTVMDILSTSLFTTSVLGALGGISYLFGSAIATGVLSAGFLPALGIVVGAGFAILGRVSK